MKSLVIPALLVPSMAMAGVVLVDGATPPVAMAPTVAPTQITAEHADAQAGFIDLRDVAAAGPVSASTPAISAVPISPPEAVWVARTGTTLHKALAEWAKTAHWHLQWDAYRGDKDVDYPIDAADVTFHGSIDQAAASFIRLYESARDPLKLAISPDQHLLIVSLKY